jgi:chromosomal replication initiation ATPase DnaA
VRIVSSRADEGTVVPLNEWARILQHIKRRVNPQNYATWFHPTRLEGTDNIRLTVRVPTHLCQKRLSETYGELLRAVLQEMGMPDTQLEFLCSELKAPAPLTVPSLASTHESSEKIIHAQRYGVTIKMIQRRVGEHFGVFPPDLKLRSGSKATVFARQVAIYLTKQITSASLPKIGREFGGKHHSTILSSIQKIEARRRTDVEFNRTIGELFHSLQ